MNKPSALGTQHLSPYGPHWETMDRGTLDGGLREEGKILLDLVYWGFWETCKIRLWKRAPLHMGTVGEPGGGGASITGDFKAWMEGSGHKSLSLWELCDGNLEGGLLYWGP